MSTDSRLSSAVAHLLHWSLPASPLFLAILMLLAHAPYAAPIVSPSSFYLACMLGALLALVTLPLCPWGHRARRTWCVGSGIALEAAWIILLVAEQQRSAELLLLGSALAGCSSACLLVLWLWVDQASEAAGEVTKLAGAFGIAYLTYTFFSVVPHAGVVSYLFPLLTCPPLFVDLGNEPPNATETADSSPKVHPPVPQAIAVTLTLALFGAGFSALGFGGPQVEQGAGLLAILLFCCLLPFGGNMHILRIAAVPLVVFSLCLGALAGVGNAFAFFLAGCGSLVIWLFLMFRFGYAGPRSATIRSIALRLLHIGASAGAGMMLGNVVFGALPIADANRAFALVAAIVVADFFWQASSLTCRSADRSAAYTTIAGVMAPAAHVTDTQTPTASDDSRLGFDPEETGRVASMLALSPREAQVAVLLCQSKSVGYISKKLGVANSTTKTHVRHVYEKANVHSRDELQLELERLLKAM